LHVNDVAKEFILTSLIHELYANLQNFEVASDMLEFLEVRLGEQYLIPEQDIDTEMAEVVSIQSEILTLKKKMIYLMLRLMINLRLMKSLYS
jgi:hypothetical protein